MEKLFTEAVLLRFSQTPANQLEQYRFGFGTMIRLRLLRPKSALYREFVLNDFPDQDKMTMELIKAFHRYLHDKG